MTGLYIAEMDREHDAWLEIVRLTKDGATITDADWSAPADSEATPGQELICAIKRWGECLALLRIAQGDSGKRYAQKVAGGY